jgi:hypothetical protein
VSDHRTLLDALLEDADEHEAAGRIMQAANARAAVENLRDVPPWNGEEVRDDDVD